MYVQAVGSQKYELEELVNSVSKQMEEVKNGILKENEQTKQLVVTQISKKADYQMIDHIKEQVNKKVDYDYFTTISNKLKGEMNQLMQTNFNEFQLSKSQRDERSEERLIRAELQSERANQELTTLKDRMERMQEMKKRETEDSADYIKGMIQTSRNDFEKDVNHILDQIEVLKKDLTSKCQINELLETKAKI